MSGRPRGEYLGDSEPIGELSPRVARTTGMAPSPVPDADLAVLRAEAAHLRRVNQELLATVAELRAAVEKQQAHIERLVRMTFGRRSERVTGPTLFGDLPDPDPLLPATAPPGTID